MLSAATAMRPDAGLMQVPPAPMTRGRQKRLARRHTLADRKRSLGIGPLVDLDGARAKADAYDLSDEDWTRESGRASAPSQNKSHAEVRNGPRLGHLKTEE